MKIIFFRQLVIIILLLQSFSILSAQTCRTPGHKRTVIFMPAAYHLNTFYAGDYSGPCQTASQHQQYTITTYIQSAEPGLAPSITLTDFIEEMESDSIGILFMDSHAASGLFGIEFFVESDSGYAAAWAKYDEYIKDGIDSSYIGVFSSSSGHVICITDKGLEHWCTNLDETLVFAKACHSSSLNGNWNSLVTLGYDDEVAGYAKNDVFFERMDGTKDRGPKNKSRSVEQAANGIITTSSSGTARLIITGNKNVVLSPVVIDHEPKNYGLVEEGQSGYVEFDCEMDQTVSADQVVKISGTIGKLNDVKWANNHRIEFTVSDLEDFASINFMIPADSARSAHNKIPLDGNNNPNETDGVGPNGDFYSWSSLTSYYSMMDFEDGVDGAAIQSSIPGMEFITTAGYDWIYGDKRTEYYNIYPYNNCQYWCEGNTFAWLGPNQGTGRINFEGATATSVSLGTSAESGLYLEAYDAEGNLLDNDFTGGNLSTNTLGQVTVRGAGIDHVLIHDSGNRWLIDNLVVVDLLQETLIDLPENYSAILDELHTIAPHAVEEILVVVDNIASVFKIILNWPGSEMKLVVYKPDGEMYGEYQTTEPPIEVEIQEAEQGEWKFEVTAVDVPEDNYPFAIVASVEDEPSADCYIQDEDIWHYPAEPVAGELFDIFAAVHCDSASSFVDNVLVKCFLGNPEDGGVQISNGEYALDLSNGGVDTLCFHFDTLSFSGSRNIYIVIDPADELREYSEDNNTASISLEITDVPDQMEEVPTNFELSQNFPNPFNPSTTIRYKVPELSFVSLKVYDVLGREVAILVNEEKTTGIYDVRFNAGHLASGIYFYRICAGEYIQTKKLILLK